MMMMMTTMIVADKVGFACKLEMGCCFVYVVSHEKATRFHFEFTLSCGVWSE